MSTQQQLGESRNDGRDRLHHSLEIAVSSNPVSETALHQNGGRDRNQPSTYSAAREIMCAAVATAH